MVLAPQTSSLPKLLLRPGRWTVGSAATCSYRIVGDGVCPRHALVLCGGQSAVLKAWDVRTWHNGQPVRGEVRLQQGDRVTLGSVEFSVEPEDILGTEPLTSEVRRETTTHSTLINPVRPDPEGWDLERLRGQIQELRDELAQRFRGRVGPVSTVSNPDPLVEQSASTAVDQAFERIAELERSAAESQDIADRLRQQLAAALAEQARRETELQQVVETLRPALELSQSEVDQLRLERDQLRAASARREQSWQQEAAELRGEWDQLRSETAQRQQAWQHEISELRNERDQLQSETAEREQAWQQEAVEWSTERNAWQEELIALANARQQASTDWEQRHSTLFNDATHWKSECEQLQTGWQFQQAAWDQERSRLKGELRQREEAVQQTLQAVTLREEELSEQNQQLLAERQQIEADRQQFEAERQQFEQDRQQFTSESEKREPAIAALADERRRVEERAAEVSETLADVARQTAELEQQQANFTREKQTLEHSWTWLQTDRRKLVDEKEEWQRERALWQAECERRDADIEHFHREREEFANARESLPEQLDAEHPQPFAEQPAGVAQFERFAADSSSNRIEESSDTLLSGSVSVANFAAAESPLTSLADDWSIGVDLTAPRETHSTPSVTTTASETHSDWMTPPLTRSISQELSAEELLLREEDYSSTSWPTTSMPQDVADVVDETVIDETHASSQDWETLPTVSPMSLEKSDRPFGSESAQLDDPSADGATDAAKEDLPAIEMSSVEEVETNAVEPEAEPDPKESQVVSILDSMAFSDEEHIDDSVSRYMQQLLARTTQSGDREASRPLSAPSTTAVVRAGTTVTQPPKPSTALGSVPAQPFAGVQNEAVNVLTSPVAESENEVTPLKLQPVHRQDKDAVRATTEHLRQVANQQTVKHVEAANWKLIKRSIVIKLVLAAISFTMSAGLLLWGYYHRPDFLILGVCASGLGIMTWLDLILAIRQARKRMARLAGSKTKTSHTKA